MRGWAYACPDRQAYSEYLIQLPPAGCTRKKFEGGGLPVSVFTMWDAQPAMMQISDWISEASLRAAGLGCIIKKLPNYSIAVCHVLH